jgi:hypothetical protein
LPKLPVKNEYSPLPMVDIIEPSKMTVDDLVETLGRTRVKAVLRLSMEGKPRLPWHALAPGSHDLALILAV